MNMLIPLKSVGCFIDSETNITYPMDSEGVCITDPFSGVHLENCTKEWRNTLSEKDKLKLLKLKFNSHV